MTSSLFELDHPKEEAAALFVADVGRALQNALLERKALAKTNSGVEKLTQQEIANRLGVNRSGVNRMFSGYRNFTLENLAELCWAMDIEPKLVLEQLHRADGANCAIDTLRYAQTSSATINPVQISVSAVTSKPSNQWVTRPANEMLAGAGS